MGVRGFEPHISTLRERSAFPEGLTPKSAQRDLNRSTYVLSGRRSPIELRAEIGTKRAKTGKVVRKWEALSVPIEGGGNMTTEIQKHTLKDLRDESNVPSLKIPVKAEGHIPKRHFSEP